MATDDQETLDRLLPIWQQGGMATTNPLTVYRLKHTPPMSSTDLAKLLGVSRSFLCRVEAGRRKVGRKLLPVIKRKTGIPPDVMRPDLARDMEMAG